MQFAGLSLQIGDQAPKGVTRLLLLLLLRFGRAVRLGQRLDVLPQLVDFRPRRTEIVRALLRVARMVIQLARALCVPLQQFAGLSLP